jgi:hypothetical protein
MTKYIHRPSAAPANGHSREYLHIAVSSTIYPLAHGVCNRPAPMYRAVSSTEAPLSVGAADPVHEASMTGDNAFLQPHEERKAEVVEQAALFEQSGDRIWVENNNLSTVQAAKRLLLPSRVNCQELNHEQSHHSKRGLHEHPGGLDSAQQSHRGRRVDLRTTRREHQEERASQRRLDKRIDEHFIRMRRLRKEFEEDLAEMRDLATEFAMLKRTLASLKCRMLPATSRPSKSTTPDDRLRHPGHRRYATCDRYRPSYSARHSRSDSYRPFYQKRQVGYDSYRPLYSTRWPAYDRYRPSDATDESSCEAYRRRFCVLCAQSQGHLGSPRSTTAGCTIN